MRDATRLVVQRCAQHIPNTQAASALPWGDYRTSVDAIEAATGLDLLNRIPAAVQAELEAGVDSGGRGSTTENEGYAAGIGR